MTVIDRRERQPALQLPPLAMMPKIAAVFVERGFNPI